MMVEVPETCKTIKNNLETKLVVLMNLHKSIVLINTISTQKKHSKPILTRTQNSTFWVLIIPPNRHVASPLAMLKTIKGMQAMFLQKEYPIQKVCVQVRLYLPYKQIRLCTKTIMREQMPYRNKFQGSINSKEVNPNFHLNLSVFR